MRVPPDKERRTAFRVDDSLPLVVRDLEEVSAADDTENARPSEVGTVFPAGEVEDKDLAASLRTWLRTLNQKLDVILERLPPDILKTPARPVNLSTSGMRFRHRKPLAIHQLVRIKMLLPSFPAKEIVLEGKVTRVVPSEGGEYEVALSFPELNEEVRRAILEHTLNRQRKEISAKKAKV